MPGSSLCSGSAGPFGARSALPARYPGVDPARGDARALSSSRRTDVQGEQAERIVATLRDRRVMAHVSATGVYNCGIPLVIPDGREAIWDAMCATGLEPT